MRPRLYTAENQARHQAESGLHAASMRPRLYTAENLLTSYLYSQATVASMRPRLYTAENSRMPPCTTTQPSRFNEAAALHRGKLGEAVADLHVEAAASMRPRLYTAENAGKGDDDGDQQDASMRPRLYTAENPPQAEQAPRGAMRLQ